MDQNERRIIDDLFGKLRQAEGQGGPRDSEAERHIAERLSAQPAAPYYMTQAIVIQEQALAAAQDRIQELEGELRSRPAGGGFLAGLFGGGRPDPARQPAPPPAAASGRRHDLAASQPSGPWGRPGGGSFLGGALQTAMAVAGGVVVGNMIAGLLAPKPAVAAEPEPDPAEDVAAEDTAEEPGEEAAGDWGDFGDEEF
ncbi:DUF2076 domain-containing protein [Arenibaculum sp.]|jgi:hypothetical protein|uniref:DUF2076 domain-containing protein n=1 Tax=Arenibaculum sp. TaxID=2865862 RepID=UPI002E10702C|nr:DUF2076 domain-containing protein [Arenibaculum sp.]